MFTGIDEVDWASLRHAYGSAADVPALLRGLASADPAEREGALDGMYGSVHHQGNVYDSTLACVPFLFSLVTRAEVPDRGGIVELLVSIGTESEGAGAGRAPAHAAVRSGAEVFAALAADPDPWVRRAAPAALVRFLDDPARVLGLLRERITVERDDRVLLALTEGLGLFVRRHPAHAAAAVDLLAAQSAPPYGPGPRLAALGQLALGAPDRLPADLVPTVVRLLRDRSEQRSGGRPDERDRPGTDTLVGRIRRLRPSDEEGSYLLRTLHTALDDRVADRIALLTGQLTSPAPVDRCNAVWMSAGLLREWRADYTGPVALLGAQLAEEHDALRDAAVSVLSELFDLAAPAAGHLHALVTSRPDLWVRRWERGAPALGGPVKALARTGDARAVPVLAQLLAGPLPPDDLGHAVVHLGRAASPLAPALRRRLAQVARDWPDRAGRAVPLLSALTALGDAEAVPEVLRLLRTAPDRPGPRDTVVGYAIRMLDALGAAAWEAVPVLRGLLDTGYAAAAAGALWSAGEDVSVALPVLLRELTHERSGLRRLAAGELARLGPAARPALPALRRMTAASRVRERTSAAAALWRIGGDPEPVLPVFRAAWAENPHTRVTIAACLADMGPAGTPLLDLVAAEMAGARRHTARMGGYGSHDIQNDEELLRVCERVLAGG
ncbi:HEAT repeat domain-containing protein [Streptomyces sp. NPDC051636]|uniref:HEAT repeat domain-containing protein n=1 Tax=Streptomyces sp. NPDC051636 TaxID=3365663 RepID=UPI0037B17B70